MSLLQKKINRESKIVQRRGYYLYLLYQKGLYEIFKKYSDQALTYTSSALLNISDKSEGYKQLYNSRILAQLRTALTEDFHRAALEMEQYWSKKRKIFDLYGRVTATYLDRKASPPWRRSKLDLKDQLRKDDEHDPGKGHFKYYMSMIVDNIMMQVQRGSLNEETPNQILKRVKNLFNRNKKQGVREAKSNYIDDLQLSDNELSLYGKVDIETGFYNQDMLDILKMDSISANKLEFRQYSPDMSDELLANNKALYRLEQQLYSDYANLFHSGQNEGVPDLKGIDDLEWTVDRPGVCEYCDAREGLTMAEIKDKIDDEFGDKVPSLHPNCRCTLEPRVDPSVWKDVDTQMQDVSWDPDTGSLDMPTSMRKNLRLDLNLDEYINYLSQGGGK